VAAAAGRPSGLADALAAAAAGAAAAAAAGPAAPGSSAAVALSAEQKRKLLWGTKKVEAVVQKVGLVRGRGQRLGLGVRREPERRRGG
jgi:hypothetical protein